MKSLQRLCATVALSLVFVLPVFAGEISTGPGAEPPPPPPQAAVEGSIEMPGEEMTLSSFAETGLSLLQSVLSLF